LSVKSQATGLKMGREMGELDAPIHCVWRLALAAK
jgi:hypothetical protein